MTGRVLLLRWVLTLGASLGAVGRCPGLYQGTPPAGHTPVPRMPVYNDALRSLNVAAVMHDVRQLLTHSLECWPADYGNYGPLFVRLAWHCSGTYRATDGRGGCTGGRQRFEPEASWEDNTNLDKARALLAPIKEKYGSGLSWGDLIVIAGTTAIKEMRGPVRELCVGRVDEPDGTSSLDLGPSEHQEKVAPCAIAGQCEAPLGTTTVGLIYLNLEGPVVQGPDGRRAPVPDPARSSVEVRDTFLRMGMNDTETVALIGGGHAFGKSHGACPKGAGPPPEVAPLNPWPGKCGTGVGPDTYTSGIEGPWTTDPTKWDNEFFRYLLEHPWEKHLGPGQKWQWRIPQATGPKAQLMRLTSDVALLHDASYLEIVRDFAARPEALDEAFAQAWFKLTHRGGQWSEDKRCVRVESVLV